MTKLRIRDFASTIGVTVKTLLHYERLGLLSPARTASGHRVYGAADETRLRHVRALKQIGVPLVRIRSLLDLKPAVLRRELETLRESLGRERVRLERSDRAVALVGEVLRTMPGDRRSLERLADVLEMPEAIDGMKQYFDDDVWERARGFYDRWPSPAWVALCLDIAANADGTDQRRAEWRERYNELANEFWREIPADLPTYRKLHAGFARAWRDREHWPDVVKRRFDDYGMDALTAVLRNPV